MRVKKLSILPLVTSILLVVFYCVAPVIVYADEYVITGNGSDSDSEIVVSNSQTATVEQSGSAVVQNEVNSETSTGSNQASSNVGDVNINTGNVNQSTNIQNSLNTSLAETPCCQTNSSITIAQNGSSSQNSVTINTHTTSNIVANQSAIITNNVNGSGNTGDNQGNNNVGQVNISTGNVYASSIINNSPINVSSISAAANSAELAANIKQNGADSENDVKAQFSNDLNVFVNNIFLATNNNFWNLNTGGNSANSNVGNVGITTGNAYLNAIINNLANISNVNASCCKTASIPETPENPDSPNNPPSNPENQNSSGGSNNQSSNGSSGSSPSQTSAPSILGLSATSGESSANKAIGVFMIAVGLYAISKKSSDVKSKISKTKK